MGMCLLYLYQLGHLPPPVILGLVLSSESRSSTADLLLPCTVCVCEDAGLGSSAFIAGTRDTSDDADAEVDFDGGADPPPMVKGFLAWVSQSRPLLATLR